MFQNAWYPFPRSFSLHSDLVGSFSRVFPGKLPVNSDLSVLQFLEEDHCTNMPNFSLEGIMESKNAKHLINLSH